jgi:hypothetical protein
MGGCGVKRPTGRMNRMPDGREGGMGGMVGTVGMDGIDATMTPTASILRK